MTVRVHILAVESHVMYLSGSRIRDELRDLSNCNCLALVS